MKLGFFFPLLFQKIIWLPTRFILRIFGRLEIIGLENLLHINSPVIFAANHSSDIDPFMVPASLPFFSKFSPLFYMVREKTFYDNKGWKKQLFNSWFIHLWGGYEVAVDLKNYEIALEKHIKLLQRGGNFCIFPEGKITRDGQLQEGKGGISYLAHSFKSVIVPVGIKNVYNITFMDLLTRKRKIKVIFGKPIFSNELHLSIPQHSFDGNVWKLEASAIMSQISTLLEN